MYRSYQPLFPAASRYLQEKWDQASYQEHRRKVELAVPAVNTTALPTPLHLQVNLKKMQLEKERQAARDRENLLHYARLGGIKRSQGRVDHWNFYCRHSLSKSRLAWAPRSRRVPGQAEGSLNWEKRQRDLEQIYWENRQLMKRLAEKKSELAQGRWQQDWHREQMIRNSLARYPRGTRSCQAGTERRRQRTGGSSSPASACRGSPSASPNRAHFPCSGTRTGLVSKRFWESRNEPAPEGQVTTAAFSPPILRKRDVTQQSGPSVQWSNKGAVVSAKDFSTKEGKGSSARPDLPGEMSLEKSVAGAVVAPTKLPPSLRLREKLRFSEKNSTPISKRSELSAKRTEPC